MGDRRAAPCADLAPGLATDSRAKAQSEIAFTDTMKVSARLIHGLLPALP
jgi:hypothetical protein